MKKNLIILAALLFVTLTAKSQNLFFIGEHSYPCTETSTFQANSDDKSELSVLFGKDSTAGILGISTEFFMHAIFSKKLIIYLKDGIVITCNNEGETEYVDDRVKAVYYLTNKQLNKLKNSDIHTVRYTLENNSIDVEWNFSASSLETSTKNIITKFFKD